jgi:predicted permease
VGGSRGRRGRQSSGEGLLLTASGAGAGLLAGSAGLQLLLALTPASLDRFQLSRIDPVVLAFTVGTSVVWGLLLSLAPVTELFRAEPGRSLQHSRGTDAPVRYRARAALIVGQVASSVVLLVGAGLLVRAFIEVVRVDPGFQTDQQLTFRLLLPRETFLEELEQKLRAIPGVRRVGAISHLPYDDLPNWGLPYSATTPIPPDAPTADARSVSPELFDTLGVELVAGRRLTKDDRNGKAAVVVIDDKLAALLWPGENAIGRTFFTNVGSQKATVVGIVRHTRLRSLVDDLLPQIFVPWPIARRNPMAFVVQADGDPVRLAPAVRSAVTALDRRVAPYDIRPMSDYVHAARATRRFTVTLATAFAVSALLLTCIGVYGVLAYAVARRRHELGLRRALGASAGRVMREVLREGLTLAIAGCACGLAAALVAGRLLQSQLYGVHPRDPLVLALGTALILAGGTIACAVPAYRAIRVSPMDALRTD